MKKLDIQLNEIATLIPKHEFTSDLISSSSVGWHIEHSLLTINLIISAIKKSNPGEYKWKFNWSRIYVFTTNKIPRGRAKAPGSVKPKNDFNADTLQNHFNITLEKIKELNSLKKNNFFEHPYFGKLNLKPAIKFLIIHTQHHIDIMNDIIKIKAENNHKK